MIQNIIPGPPESNKSLWSSCHSRHPSPPHPAVDTDRNAEALCTAPVPKRTGMAGLYSLVCEIKNSLIVR